MKIGIDVKCLSRRWTGISIYCADIIKNLSIIDNENQYILYSNKPFKLDFSLPKNFQIKIFNAKSGTIFVRTKLKKILINDKIDVFWGPDHCLPKKSRHYKTILTVHDLAILRFKNISTKLNTFYIKMFLKKMCKEATKIIAVSQTTKADIKKFYNIFDKVEVVYAGDSPYRDKKVEYEIEDVDNTMDKYNINGKYMLFVSTIEPRKNIVNIIRAFNRYREDGSEIKLVLVGGLGWKTKKILFEIDSSPYKNDIIMTGYVSSVEKEILYRNAQFLIFPSLYEGFGLPILEAMSVGLPVVTSNCSGMKEVADEIGFMVDDPLNYLQIYEQMKKVSNLNELEKKDIYDKSIAKAREFTRMKSATQILKIINEIRG